MLREGGPRGPPRADSILNVLWSVFSGAGPFQGRFRQLWAASGQRLALGDPLGQTIYSKVLWSALTGACPFQGRFLQLWASSGQRLSALAIFRPDIASSGPLPALFRAALGLSGLLVAALALSGPLWVALRRQIGS